MAEKKKSAKKKTPKYKNPTVRGEQVTILGPKPLGFTGLGHLNGDIMVSYPDGEVGCVRAQDIQGVG